MEGLGSFRNISSLAGSINNLYSNILSINNGTALRSANDLFNVSISSTGNYLYYNNSSVLGVINTSNSNNSWSINSSGNAQFPLLNVSGVSSTSNLCIGSSSMRTASDRLNVSLSSTGPYMFFNDGGTLGVYNTDLALFPWFVEVDGDATFSTVNSPSISTPHLKATGKIKRERAVDSTNTYNVTNSTTSLTYLTSSNNTITIVLNALDASNNFNMYEFRCTGADYVRINANGVTVYDNLNVSRTSILTNSQKYFKFHYIEQNGTFNYYQFV